MSFEKFSEFWNDAERIDNALFKQANLKLVLRSAYLKLDYFIKSIKSSDGGIEAVVFCLLLLFNNSACKPCFDLRSLARCFAVDFAGLDPCGGILAGTGSLVFVLLGLFSFAGFWKLITVFR